MDAFVGLYLHSWPMLVETGVGLFVSNCAFSFSVGNILFLAVRSPSLDRSAII